MSAWNYQFIQTSYNYERNRGQRLPSLVNPLRLWRLLIILTWLRVSIGVVKTGTGSPSSPSVSRGLLRLGVATRGWGTAVLLCRRVVKHVICCRITAARGPKLVVAVPAIIGVASVRSILLPGHCAKLEIALKTSLIQSPNSLFFGPRHLLHFIKIFCNSGLILVLN